MFLLQIEDLLPFLLDLLLVLLLSVGVSDSNILFQGLDFILERDPLLLGKQDFVRVLHRNGLLFLSVGILVDHIEDCKHVVLASRVNVLVVGTDPESLQWG
jgi:hypothetical protein